MARRSRKTEEPTQDRSCGGSLGGWPLAVDHVENWAWRHGVFTPEETEQIIAIGTSRQLDKATTHAENDSDKIRNSYVTFLGPCPETDWIFQRMASVINEINTQYFGFELTGLNEGLQFTRYTAPGEHYDWHVDRGYAGRTRKLSVSVLLNDPAEYKGGNLQFQFGRQPDKAPQEHGMGIFFPSYTLHRVTPITKGIRYSLVCWVEGPPFR